MKCDGKCFNGCKHMEAGTCKERCTCETCGNEFGIPEVGECLACVEESFMEGKRIARAQGRKEE